MFCPARDGNAASPEVAPFVGPQTGTVAIVREPISTETVLDLEMGYAEAEGEQLLPLAEQLVDLAADPHPADGHSPSGLLSLAGQYYVDAGDFEKAESVLRQALAVYDGGGLDPRCFLVDLMLEAGRVEEAMATDNELRKTRPSDLVAYMVMGNSWADHDQRRAMGWVNRGLDLAERTGQQEESSYALLCVTRFHLRQDQGLDVDEYDEIALDVLAEAEDEGLIEQ